MPTLVLASWERVHVDDGVNAFCRASIDDAVNQPEAILLDLGRIKVIHEVAVIDGNPDTIQSETRKELGVLLREEVSEELVCVRIFLKPQ